jgi:hypothetical protein
MATDRKAEVTWHSDLMSGAPIDSATSGAFGGLDERAARSEEPNGLTSPEELTPPRTRRVSMAFPAVSPKRATRRKSRRRRPP